MIEKMKAKFKKVHGYELNIQNPKTFSEKIQWMKLFGKLEKYSKYVDKYEVRDFVKDRIGEQYLVPLIQVNNNVKEINFELLPNSFVMKATHGCGWNIIVNDKSNINEDIEKKKMEQWLKTDYSKKTGENNYKGIIPRIIIEELLQDPSGDLKDYKIFCFHGVPHHIQVSGNRFNGRARSLFDLNWNKLPVQSGNLSFHEPLEKPAHLNKMIKLAEKLASDFPFVRVDFYYTNNQIFFGELTFTPSNGFRRYKPYSFDKMCGDLLDLYKPFL
ncbi:ATP-grasp fold amidoligase family protein [Priestia megaterium]